MLETHALPFPNYLLCVVKFGAQVFKHFTLTVGYDRCAIACYCTAASYTRDQQHTGDVQEMWSPGGSLLNRVSNLKFNTIFTGVPLNLSHVNVYVYCLLY